MLNLVEHEKSFITSRPGQIPRAAASELGLNYLLNSSKRVSGLKRFNLLSPVSIIFENFADVIFKKIADVIFKKVPTIILKISRLLFNGTLEQTSGKKLSVLLGRKHEITKAVFAF